MLTRVLSPASARVCTNVKQRMATLVDFNEYVKNLPIIPDRGTAVGRSLIEG